MADEIERRRERPWWENPWIVGVGLLVITPVYAAVVDGISELGFGRTMAFVVAPTFLVGVLVAMALYMLHLRRRLDRVAEFAHRLNVVALEHAVRLSNHVMFDHIWAARHKGWRVTSSREGIRFEAPDGRAVTVGLDELNWYYIAQGLHEASPDHFPVDWMPPNYANTDLALRRAMDAYAEAKSLEKRVEQLEARTRPSSGHLATMLQENAVKAFAEDQKKKARDAR